MDDVLRQVIHVYAEEVNEQAQRIADALLAMEADPEQIPSRIEELYRQAHSLKGASASLAIEDLERLAHHLESVLLPVRRGQAPLTPELADASLRAIDAARVRAAGLAAGGSAGGAEVEEAIEILRRLHGAGDGTESGRPAEPARPSGMHAPPTAPAASPPDADGGTVRIAISRLSLLERRLDDLRTLRGRLDHRAAAAASLARAIERLWYAARGERASRRSHATEPGTDGALDDALYGTLRQLSSLRQGLLEDAELAGTSTVELDENLRDLRMVAASLLVPPLQGAVRDACRRTDKEAQLRFEGGEVQIDRRVLEELKHPLVHLVRNAVDHGVEAPAVREAIGKPARSIVSVSIAQRGGDLRVSVHDDGRGVDRTAVRQKAVERGLIAEAEAASLSDRELDELIFRPGFSTAEQVTELSGRGVGLDVVRDAVTRLGGRVELESSLGEGTRFHLAVPLTMATFETLVLEEGDRPFALPLSSVERVVRVPISDLRPVGGRLFLHLEGEALPAVRLSRLLGLAERVGGSPYRNAVVIRGAAGRAAAICERLLGHRDLVLRPLPVEVQRIRLLHAAAILANGQALLVLSPDAIVDGASEVESAAAPRFVPASGERGVRSILVADDSITTRSLLRTALETSGFRVRTAADGEEALRLAQSEPFDLVVSDIQMPNLDGFRLTARLRADPRWSRVPIVLFSTLDSEEDRRRGSASGASAYLTKNAFDRGQLIDVVQRLLQGAP